MYRLNVNICTDMGDTSYRLLDVTTFKTVILLLTVSSLSFVDNDSLSKVDDMEIRSNRE